MHVQFNHIRPWTLRWQCCAESFTVGAALERAGGGVGGCWGGSQERMRHMDPLGG